MLREFWQAITAHADRLATLRAWSELKPVIRPARDPHAVRREHNLKRLTATWRNRICFVCDHLATQEHHIIQIQHGGTNRRDNKVWVCTPCHREIHPDIMKPAPASCPAGVVPYVRNTEQRSTCPACSQDVLTVSPVLRRHGRVSSSPRPIQLEAAAQPPYMTTDLHTQFCLNRRGLSAIRQRDLARLAKEDTKRATEHPTSQWTTQNVARTLQVLR